MKSQIALAVAGLLSATAAHAEPLAINADVVSETGAKNCWLLIDSENGDSILDVFTSEADVPSSAKKLKYEGYAYPGLIDTHNHVHYNSIPLWKPKSFFVNRYQWNDELNKSPQNKEYFDNVVDIFKANMEASGDVMSTSIKYAEIRAIIGGTTMIQSSYYTKPPSLPIRNLTGSLVANSSNNILKIGNEKLQANAAKLKSKELKRYFLHIGEGRADDPVSINEFKVLRDNNLVTPGMVVIHGVALTKPEFKEMADNKMYLSWSPRSNINLYNQTTNIPAAIESGVTVALSPDWTISGSDNLLGEMKFAFDYAKKTWGAANPVTPERLYKMVTTDAALTAGLEDHFGQLKKGFAGDFFLAPKLDQNPFVSLLKTEPKNISLVFVEGKAVYGDDARMVSLYNDVKDADLFTDRLEVDGTTKRICLFDDATCNKQRYKDVMYLLNHCLPKVAPLLETH